MTYPLVEYVLRFGDNALILSQRLCAWCGKAPALEEDIAISNIALDLLGQARLWLALAGELERGGRDEDHLAFFRDSGDFHNLLLVEQVNGSYADTLVRQFLFDSWHQLALRTLGESADERVASIASKALTEVNYHAHRGRNLMIRLGHGTAKSQEMLQAAIDRLWTYIGEMFECDALDLAMVAGGIGFDPRALHAPWLAGMRDVLAKASLDLPSAATWMQTGGKRGRHTEQHGYLLAEMQCVARAHPEARW